MSSINFLPTVKEFYTNSEILITGGTGFFGKVLVEKLLRSCPSIKKIYLILRQRRKEDVQSRINEFNDDLFSKLLHENPNAFEKICIIEGDTSKRGLGISVKDKENLTNVNIVFHAAASVRFDDPLKDAVLSTVRGTRDLLDLCTELKKLQAFVYISTAFSNCQHGTPDEVLNNRIEEKLYEDVDDWKKIIKIVENIDDDYLDPLTQMIINFRPNTYLYSKALAENVCKSYENMLPLVIYRPAIVTGTIAEPFRGWMTNLNGPGGIMTGITTGALRCLYGDRNTILNIIPVDLSVNGAIISAWKRHTIDFNTSVYNSTWIKAQLSDLYHIGRETYHKLPMSNSIWYMSDYSTLCPYNFAIQSILTHFLPAVLVDAILKSMNLPPILMKMQRKIQAAQFALRYFMSNNFDMKNGNYLHLTSYLNNDERLIFPVLSVEGFKDRYDYVMKQAMSVRRYIFKEPDSTMKVWRKRRLYLYYIDRFIKYFTVFFIFYLLFTL